VPARQALADGLLGGHVSVLDYGSGKGLDVRRLRSVGVAARGWDPYFDPDAPPAPADQVLLSYVLNVIEDPRERVHALSRAWALAGQTLVVAARLTWDARRVSGEAHQDGVVTSRGTFQHLYTTEELRAQVESVTGARCFVAAPGIVYAFRDESARMEVIARRAMPAAEWAESGTMAEALAQIVGFVETFGRMPVFEELPADYLPLLAASPWPRLQRHARAAARPGLVEAGANRSVLDTLLFLGIELFNGRGSLRSMPLAVQENIRRFFSSYREACARADRLMLKIRDDAYVRGAMRNSVGKLTPTALYVHRDAMDRMPVVLRLYEHCGSIAAGRPQQFELVKLAHEGRSVSWLGYPDFDKDPHPRTAWSYGVDMKTLATRFTSFEGRANRPLLHRKEEFLHPGDPRVPKYARLTRQEVRAGLYRQPHLIGTESGWQQVLDREGVALRGHRLVRATVAAGGGDEVRDPAEVG
jgi:DNA phosphorothioation-associated putative methyltransferase